MKIKATIDKQELEIEVDEKVLEKAGYVKKKKEWKRWRSGRMGAYFFLTYDGHVTSSYDGHNQPSDGRYELGNYYQTKELAQKTLDRQLAIVRVNDRIMELNEGREGNACIDYCISNGSFTTTSYLDDYKYCEVLTAMVDEDVANQIISECEDDLKIIFGV